MRTEHHPQGRALWPLLAAALIASVHAQDVFIDSFSFSSDTRVSINGGGLPAGPATIRIKTTTDLSSFADATFPFFTDNGGGNFNIRGSYAAGAARRFFQVETRSGSQSYSPDMSIGVDVRKESNGFGAFIVGSNENVVFIGEPLEVSFTGPGGISGFTIPRTESFDMSGRSLTRQTGPTFDDDIVNGPRYVYLRIINDLEFAPGAILEHFMIIEDNDAYFSGFIDAPGFPFEFKMKEAISNPPGGYSPKVDTFQIESDGTGLIPAGAYPLTGSSNLGFQATGDIPGITSYGDGLQVNLALEFIYAGSALEFNSKGYISQITGTARITQTVASTATPTVPIPHLTRVFEGPYTMTRDAAPVDNSGPGLLPE